ncbi:hypothetical protein EAG_04957 [Camponotus floridanus]|uniref:Uncharacterized protein n=1 Tax=Camponotus floridanus TaxID=104421 RepID=E2AMF1_CAMFO|nr:hypothetical protein EAG_04957 [Camponotus floridanus]
MTVMLGGTRTGVENDKRERKGTESERGEKSSSKRPPWGPEGLVREGANPNNSTRIYIPARTRWRTVPGLKGPSFQGRLARSPNAPAAIFAKDHACPKAKRPCISLSSNMLYRIEKEAEKPEIEIEREEEREKEGKRERERKRKEKENSAVRGSLKSEPSITNGSKSYLSVTSAHRYRMPKRGQIL